MTKTAEVSIYLEITDGPALISAGRLKAIEDGAAGDEETVTEIIGDDDYGIALRFLLDPGLSPPGTKIIDSTSQIFA